MAANDYYNSSASGHLPPHNRSDAPLPPVPGSHSTQSISPVTSPYDEHDDHNNHNDYNFPPTHSNSAAALPLNTSYDNQNYSDRDHTDTSYHGHNDSQSSDPFADQNAIPLHQQGRMAPGSKRYDSDQEARYPPGHEKNIKKKGWLSGRVTWVVYILTTVQIGVFVGELIKNGMLTGTPIEIKPTFNYLIGPSPNVYITMGARYTPCMHNIQVLTDLVEPINWPCPNNTNSNVTEAAACTLSQVCGMGGVPDQTPDTSLTAEERFRDRSREPNQWWRFITPIFLHAGLVHIGFNMLLQLTLGRDMEKEIGSLRFLLVYFCAGIFGFVFGGNYANPTSASVGASGALFGVLALVLLDLLYNWSTRRSPVTDLLFLLLDIVISFVLGLLPGLDNFAHIGGFMMGLVLGICLLHSPTALRQRIGVDDPPYTTVNGGEGTAPDLQAFVKKPLGFFKGRKPLWWAWWLVRAIALFVVFIGFILLLKNFYEWRNTCSWCHRLSCLPVKDWCSTTSFTLTQTESDQPAKRALEEVFRAARKM
ncbi:rhomboid family membrane protein-like protein [Pleomassaria siparia CBS 279.74]|uniref:Rhomboid-type serine protease n=1 Tax=Pleomassaria siparia CBS 279.74 TaxID=1314801 RepID=A0A6G1KC47_9PLEO|nr:rhomboid family membrane protein-like protein [Pleomassaria siparia CBS 279.74]